MVMRRSLQHECGVDAASRDGRPSEVVQVTQSFVVVRASVFPAASMVAKNCCCIFITSPAMSNHAVTTFDMSGAGVNASAGLDVAALTLSVT
jgi:hypothetical protein